MAGPIDIPNWKRREHYELFRRADQPWFSITAEVDVTAVRESGRSFFLRALYACVRAANDTEAFRLRLRENGVWLHDSVDVTSTVLRDDETFGFGRFELKPSREEFERSGVAELQRMRRTISLELPQRVDDALVYHSTIPWLRFTNFTNAITRLHDSVPRIVFGRTTADGAGRHTMPVSVEVHHALVDGLDVGRFFQHLQQRLDE